MIHIYTGKGKGKTTAALGLSLRAIGSGKKVFIIQFLKKGTYCELKALKKFPKIKIEQFGTGCFIRKNCGQKDKNLAQAALEKIKEIIQNKRCDVLILDEINVALNLKLLDINEVIALLKSIPKKIEVVLTGRDAPRALLALADYVTEMKEVKHPFKHGIGCRKGIEF